MLATSLILAAASAIALIVSMGFIDSSIKARTAINAGKVYAAYGVLLTGYALGVFSMIASHSHTPQQDIVSVQTPELRVLQHELQCSVDKLDKFLDRAEGE